MSGVEGIGEWTGGDYSSALAGEGEYWDNFVAQRLLRGEMPGSIDWRLTFTQFRYNHDWRPLCLGPQGIGFRMREINYLLRTAAPRRGARVLDLGCGAGWLSLELARQGAHVTALDISPTNLTLARYMADTNARNFPFLYQRFAGLPCTLEDFGSVEYVYADLNTVSLPEGEYDAVVVWDSLHHVTNLESLLEQVRSALKPGGSFLGVDHAFASPRMHEFNAWVMPWIEDFYSWITENDPEWLYDSVNSAARLYDWGVLSVDYDPTPVPDFEPFKTQLFGEMLDIIRSSLRQEAGNNVIRSQESENTSSRLPTPDSHQEESPFEDVSAERVMNVLLETFRAEHFRTICPFIEPETRLPHYRHEKERIFQHYLASALIDMGESAISRGQTSGAWFAFHMTPDRPRQCESDLHTQVHRNNSSLLTYVSNLEIEWQRKNASLADLEAQLQQREAQLQQLEAELAEARRSRLPWKQRKS